MQPVCRRSVIAGSLSAALGLFPGCIGDGGGEEPDAEVSIGPWPMLGGDAANSGYAPDTSSLREEPTPRWEVERNAPIVAPPVAGPETVYASDAGGNFRGFDTETGVIVLKVDNFGSKFNQLPIVSAAAVGRDHVYVPTNDGNIMAVSPQDGAKKWRFSALGQEGTMGYTSPTLVSGSLVIVGFDGDVLSIGAVDSSVEWSTDVLGPVINAPAVGDGRVYVAGRRVRAFDAATGEDEWDSNIGRASSAPVYEDGTVYLHTVGSGVVALGASDGTRQWRYDEDEATTSRPAVADGTVYVGRGPAIHAIDASTGEQSWVAPTDGRVRGSPAVAGGTVLVGNEAGTLLALDAHDGSVRWRVEMAGAIRTAPALDDATIYVCTHHGTVTALD